MNQITRRITSMLCMSKSKLLPYRQKLKMCWNRITCCITYHNLDISTTLSFWHFKKSNHIELQPIRPVCALKHSVQVLYMLFTWCWVRIWPSPLCALIFEQLWTIISQRNSDGLWHQTTKLPLVTSGSEAFPRQCILLLCQLSNCLANGVCLEKSIELIMHVILVNVDGQGLKIHSKKCQVNYAPTLKTG